MTLDDLLANPPRLHQDASGSSVSWGLPDDVLRFIAGDIGEESRTLETGAGLSTIVFALRRAKHVSVVPDGSQVDRITRYCFEQGIPIDRLTFHIGPSETVLPSLLVANLDLVLIDGRHGFPAPFIDWYYASRALKVGGLVIVDDTQLWTGHVLRAFLLEEPDWRLENTFAKTVVFRKLREGSQAKEWTDQPFIVRSSRELGLAVAAR